MLFLIMGQDKTHSDPTINITSCYKAGDIVRVLPDSAHDGDIISNPIAAPFYLLRVSGVTEEQARLVTEALEDTNNPQLNDEGEILGYPYIRLRIRNLRLPELFLSLPSNIRQQIQQDRYYETSLSQIRNYIRHKITEEVL